MPYTLNHTPYTLHPPPHTLHPTPKHSNPKSKPRPQTPAPFEAPKPPTLEHASHSGIFYPGGYATNPFVQ